MPQSKGVAVQCLLVAGTLVASAVDAEPVGASRVLEEQVVQAERRFAASMAERDFAAFQSFLADEAVFFSGAEVLSGKAAVTEQWSAYYEGEEAPFSWCPARVVVLASGTLAHSSGPVLDPQGECVATFNTIWRRSDDGWEVVFDKGEPAGCSTGLQCLDSPRHRLP